MEKEIPEVETDDRKDASFINSDLVRGQVNTMILSTLIDTDKYGYEIINDIKDKTNGSYTIKEPTLYSALKRLESQGYITSYSGVVSNGGKRRYFSITPEGREFYERALEELSSSIMIFNRVYNIAPAVAATPVAPAVQPSAAPVSAAEAPVEAPVEETPVEEVSVEEAPVEEVPVEEAPVEEAPVEEVPVEEVPVEEVPVEEVPVEEAPVEEVPVEEIPVEEAPVEEVPVEEAPVEEVTVEEAPVEAPVEEVPMEKIPVEEPKAPSTATPRPIPEGQYVPPRPVYGGARKNGYNPTTPHEGFYYPVYEDALASQQVARQAEEEAMNSEEQDVIAQIYANAIDRTVPPVDFSFDPIHVDPTQVTGNVEFFNIHERAEQDKITIRTSGSYHPKSIPEAETAQASAPTAFFNKGRALLFASSATFGVMLIEFVLLLALMDPLSVSLQGIIFFGVTAVLMELFFVILYFKGFGKNASKSTGSNYVVVDLILFILLTIATIGIAIFQGSNLSEISVLVNHIILPVLLSFNIVVFALFYRLFKNKQ